MRQEDRKLRVVGLGGTLREDSTCLRALGKALAAAKGAGAETELLDLKELDLPMYQPGRPLEEYGPNVERLVEAMRGADAMLWSTAAYHGTLAGATKNALDFAQFLAKDERPYLKDRVVGLIATAGGGTAGVNTLEAMIHVAHALRAVAAPLSASIGRSREAFDEDGNPRDGAVEKRLERLGRLVVEMAAKLNPDAGAVDRALLGVA